MLPGKIYKPEDVLQILRKRIWLVLVPWALIAAGTAGVARKLPDMYRSTATIQVQPPQVPESIVRSNDNMRLQERVQAAQQTILSRTRLERVVQEFDLYKEERKTEIMQEIIEDMRRDITVSPPRGDAFTVSFVGRNPVTVQKVTERLASYFKDESEKQGEIRADSTTSFVESSVEEARRRLVANEDRVRQYKMAHAGELPEQRASNQAAIQGLQMQLQSLTQSLNADTGSRMLIERQIADLEGLADAAMATGAAELPPAVGGTAAQQLAAAKGVLAAMDARGYRPEHHDYKRQLAVVADLQKKADDEARRIEVGAGGGLPPAELARQRRLAGLREDLEQVKKQIAGKQDEEKRLRASAAVYQTRLDRTPLREAELVDLNREYEDLRKVHSDLVGKREVAAMSANMERRRIGELFILVDPARIPERPFSPNRALINIFGIVGGLAVGLGLVALLEYRDSTFKADHELAGLLALPVLAVVPIMQSDAERRADFRRRLFVNLGFGSTVAVCLAVLTYTFVFVR